MKTQPKKEPLKKHFTHVDNRKQGKVKRSDHKEYVEWLKQQPLECLECGSLHSTELHHVDPQDSRTCVVFCSYCHRGDLRDKRHIINDKSQPVANCLNYVTKGYYLHRGTKSKVFKSKWSDDILLKIAERLYSEYKSTLYN